MRHPASRGTPWSRLHVYYTGMHIRLASGQKGMTRGVPCVHVEDCMHAMMASIFSTQAGERRGMHDRGRFPVHAAAAACGRRQC